MNVPEQLELDDIQGIIYRGYGALAHARFVLLEIEARAAARAWLAAIADDVTVSVARPTADDRCINVAFTHAGLRELGLPESALEQFAVEFREGMITEHRQRLLGDHGQSSPASWRWGGEQGPAGADNLHVLLTLYAGSEDDLEAFYSGLANTFAADGLKELEQLRTVKLPGQKEHFGFRDGIAQPWIRGKPVDNDRRGTERRVEPDNVVAAGEFLLGYENEYGELPGSPLVAAGSDPGGHLAPGRASNGEQDLGRNGSYLVFRQLSQEVENFWRYVTENAPDANGQDGMWLAAKMVGRWPSGAPLSLYPNGDPAAADPSIPEQEYKNADNFGYTDDPAGAKCPVGSHIRRTNPRDTLSDNRQTAVKVAKRHRLLRRGRAYGEPVADSMHPNDILEGSGDGERGLHFLCFNADLGRQFEFVQHTWVNNQKFGGLYRDADPVMGDHDPRWLEDDGSVPETGTFTAPREKTVRHRATELQRFVHVRGGAYFFMPGKRALRYLASLE